MVRLLIDAVLAWLMLAIALLYMLEMPWRRWRNRPVKSWMPLWGEILLPLLYVWLAIDSRSAIVVRVLTALFMIVALFIRLAARRRLGVPAWPPV